MLDLSKGSFGVLCLVEVLRTPWSNLCLESIPGGPDAKNSEVGGICSQLEDFLDFPETTHCSRW